MPSTAKTVKLVLLAALAAGSTWLTFRLLDWIMIWGIYSWFFQTFRITAGLTDTINGAVSIWFTVISLLLIPMAISLIFHRKNTRKMLIIAGAVSGWLIVVYFISQPRPGQYFNPITGQPKYQYIRMADGKIDLYPMGYKFHPKYGTQLQSLTPNIIKNLEEEKAKELAKRKALEQEEQKRIEIERKLEKLQKNKDELDRQKIKLGEESNEIEKRQLELEKIVQQEKERLGNRSVDIPNNRLPTWWIYKGPRSGFEPLTEDDQPGHVSKLITDSIEPTTIYVNKLEALRVTLPMSAEKLREIGNSHGSSLGYRHAKGLLPYADSFPLKWKDCDDLLFPASIWQTRNAYREGFETFITTMGSTNGKWELNIIKTDSSQSSNACVIKANE